MRRNANAKTLSNSGSKQGRWRNREIDFDAHDANEAMLIANGLGIVAHECFELPSVHTQRPPSVKHRETNSEKKVGTQATGNTLVGCLAVLFGTLYLGFIFGSILWNSREESSTGNGGAATRNVSESDAIVAVQERIRLRVRSPSTLEFPWFDIKVEKRGTSYTITSHFDSQNGFGATVRTHYVAKVDSSGNVIDITYLSR